MKAELQQRVAKLQTLLREQKLDAMLVVQNADLYYLAGSVQAGVMAIPDEGEPVYYVRKDYGRAREESPLPEVRPLPSLKELPALLQQEGFAMDRAAMELDVLPVNTFHFYQQLFPDTRWVDGAPLIRKVKAVKSPWEISRIREAAKQMERVHHLAKEWIREGMREIDLAAKVEVALREMGHQGLVRMRAFNQEIFFGHIFSGANAAVPSFFDSATGGMGLNPSSPQSAGVKAMAKHEPIIVDYVGCVDGYFVDQTRLYAIGGLSEELMRAFESALAIQEAIVERAKPGALWGDLYELALGMVREMGLSDYFMGYKTGQAKFVGHGIGVELDEYPFLAKGMKHPLERGMVFALEPKFVFPGQGVVGIENTWLVTDTGCERLTLPPDDLVVL